MKRILSIVLSLTLILGHFAGFSVNAASDIIISGDYEYELLDDGTVSISKYIGTDSNLTIPEKLDGKTVTKIGKFAFDKNETIENVTVGKSIKEIE